MNLTHVSDLHGHLDALVHVFWRTDAWVFTGDLFPDAPAGDARQRERFQRAWFRENVAAFRAAIGQTPVLVVDGNHDFASLTAMLRDAGMDATEITPRGVDLGGHRFAGFPHIPAMGGWWAHEASDDELDRLARETLDSGCDVLVTHCPPAGILSGAWGNLPLANRLRGTHGVVEHLFGHVHEHAGQDVTVGRVRHYNGSLGARLVTV